MNVLYVYRMVVVYAEGAELGNDLMVLRSCNYNNNSHWFYCKTFASTFSGKCAGSIVNFV